MAARMRTAPGALAIIQENDPGTGVTLHYLRGLIHRGEIPVVNCGRKKLINVDLLLEYLAAGQSGEAH